MEIAVLAVRQHTIDCTHSPRNWRNWRDLDRDREPHCQWKAVGAGAFLGRQHMHRAWNNEHDQLAQGWAESSVHRHRKVDVQAAVLVSAAMERRAGHCCEATVIDVVSRDGEIWFQLKGWDGLFPARCFRPIYPHIIDQFRKLEAPSPERVLEEA